MIDVSVVRDRLSTYHGTRVPQSIARFVAWLAEDPQHKVLFEARAYLLPSHDLSFADPAVPLPERPKVRYHREPPEFIEFASTGTDGERIGVLELAPELARDELPFVSFFPMDFEVELCVLGDELRVALSTFLAYLSIEEPVTLPGLFEQPLTAGRWPDDAPAFVAPNGYRFVRTVDRAGVLAPADAFGPDIVHLDYSADLDDFEEAAGRAARLLADGYPASAIAVAREVRAAGAETEQLEAACAVWRAAALALRRPWHAAMVDEIVESDRTRRASDVRSYGPYTITNYAFDDGTP
jgi:hypothetical protein